MPPPPGTPPSIPDQTLKSKVVSTPVVSEERTIQLPPGPEHIQGVRLIGPSGPVRLGLGTFKIGRAVDADVRLEDKQVSRAHALLVVERASVVVEDLKTVNGTLLNGHEVKGRERLQAGDVLRFGEADFTVELV